MGYFVDGKWIIESEPPSEKGKYIRADTTFRERITADGSSPYPAAPHRYHLYVTLSCPWAHRVLLMRKLRGLEQVISVSIADPVANENGWEFTDRLGCLPDTVNNAKFLRDIYVRANPNYTGRATVPILWDRLTQTIVNNESLEIMRMLDLEFDAYAESSVHFCTRETEAAINETIQALYPINNGVYRVGFAKTQSAYDEAITELFAALDYWEQVLTHNRFLGGETITEADWCFFVTLIRFDCAYYQAFKCNRRRIIEYPNLWCYLQELFALPGVAQTCNFQHIRQHYSLSYPERCREC